MSAGRFVFIVWVLGISGLTAFGQNLLDAGNNPSFETPDVAEGPTSVSLSAPPWTLSGPRQMFDFGFGPIPLNIGCGIFDNPSTVAAGQIANAHGEQLAYIFANSYTSAISGDPMDHAFTQILPTTFQAGKEYTLAIGVAHAQVAPPADSVLTMSLFAYDSGNPSIEELLASRSLTVANVNGLTLTDFLAATGGISGSAIGKQIGIRISTQTAPKPPSATGQFDFDNVRLTAIPEPASLGVCAAALLVICWRRRRN